MYLSSDNMLARITRPKLSLTVPAGPATPAVPAVIVSIPTPRSPLARNPISLSPVSPTVCNTRLNQCGFSTLQIPTFAYSQSAGMKSILKKGTITSSNGGKKLHFNEEPLIRCVTPVPEDYHGTYVKMSKEEKRWGAERQ